MTPPLQTDMDALFHALEADYRRRLLQGEDMSRFDNRGIPERPDKDHIWDSPDAVEV